MRITIFGTGYVGLVTGTCLAELGHEVLCIDIDKSKIDKLNKGFLPIYEPGLEELVIRNVKEGRLKFSTNTKKGVTYGKVIFSTVGTPPDQKNNNKADLKYVKIVAKVVGLNISKYKIFINKSTVPLGTGKICENIINKELKKRNKNIDFDVVSNPEFLREGNAINDFMLPDRIICGVENKRSEEVMKDLYKPFIKNYVNIIFTDIKSSEIIKYASNSFLATKISFINEIAKLAEKSGANIKDISKGIGSDNRIGNKFLDAGIGYGGSCFPKDIQAFIETGKEYGINFEIISSTEKVNQKQKTLVVEKLKKYISCLKGKTISIWGLSFKAETDDIREAPSINVINTLIELGVNEIKAFDPVSINNMKVLFGENKKVIFTKTSYDALENSDGLIVLTEWNEFKAPNFDIMKKRMRGKLIIDGRNILDKKHLEKIGFTYESIG